MIKQTNNGGEKLRRNGKEISALGEKTKKSISVFAVSTLPRLMRFSKENGSLERFF